MAPNPRPIPRFIADTTQEGIPHGRFAERLATAFREAVDGDRGPARGRGDCRRRSTGSPSAPGAGGSGFPAPPTARARRATLELFGHVSYVQPPGGEPTDFQAKADFTDVLAEDNPDWRIDLNDDVIGRWRGENGRAGAVTLVWGRPLVRGAVAATAELDGETVDQEVISQDRFTLIALDALEGYGDEVFMRGQALEPPRQGAGLREPLQLSGFYDWGQAPIAQLDRAIPS